MRCAVGENYWREDLEAGSRPDSPNCSLPLIAQQLTHLLHTSNVSFTWALDCFLGNVTLTYTYLNSYEYELVPNKWNTVLVNSIHMCAVISLANRWQWSLAWDARADQIGWIQSASTRWHFASALCLISLHSAWESTDVLSIIGVGVAMLTVSQDPSPIFGWNNGYPVFWNVD